MSIKALVWDFEGVIMLNHEGNMPLCIAKRLDAPLDIVHEFFHGENNNRVDLGEITQEEFWQILLDLLNLPKSKMEILKPHHDEDFFIDQHLMGIVRRYHKSYKTAMLSNYSEVLRPMVENRWQVDDAFDEIIISCEVGLAKPNPEIFALTMERLGCQPHEAVFIDDRIRNIEGARLFGMHAILFENKHQTLTELEQVLTAG